MSAAEPTIMYVCPNCFLADIRPGKCPGCGHERVECDPGDPNNPCRRPPMDAQGNIQSRAPQWWLARSVPYIRERLQKLAR